MQIQHWWFLLKSMALFSLEIELCLLAALKSVYPYRMFSDMWQYGEEGLLTSLTTVESLSQNYSRLEATCLNPIWQSIQLKQLTVVTTLVRQHWFWLLQIESCQQIPARLPLMWKVSSILFDGTIVWCYIYGMNSVSKVSKLVYAPCISNAFEGYF